MSMYCLVSKYTVSSNQADFESQYGRNGGWFKFYEACEDFLGSELLKNSDGKTYLIIDKWMAKEDYHTYIDENRLQYDQLQTSSDALWDELEVMGEYDLLQ